jgi:hypothetical protein
MREPIFVRPLSDAEREALKTGLRSQDAFVLRRCQILLAMPFLRSEGKTAYRIAQTCGCHDQTVRNVIKRSACRASIRALSELFGQFRSRQLAESRQRGNLLTL